tara:strand:+ start:1867 stop:2556 length:690 start_codon:yes stop_codon:yes gene_type:complete
MVAQRRLQTFADFLTTEQIQIDYSYLVLALILAAVLAFILAKLYVRYGTSVSNRKKFSSNFILLTTTTTLIIVVVKSSLALSLGLVGALSIVRFRAAIKEPEELAFLFLAIAVGLGLGAGQLLTTLLSFTIISSLIWGRSFIHKKEENQNLYIVVSGKNIKLEKIIEILKKYCSAVTLKRFDQVEGENGLEASFLVDFDSFTKLEKLRKELNILSKSINISYLDKSGLF